MPVDLDHSIRHRHHAPACAIQALVLGCGLLVGTACNAQTLGIALEQAWTRHPQAGAFTARASEAQARAEVAAGLTPAPGALALSNATDRFQADAGKDAWELEWTIPLWLPGQRAARTLEADSSTAEVSASRAVLSLQIAGELRELWWALDAARQSAGLAERRAAAARTLALDVSRRFKAGELSRVDANQAQNEQLAADGDLLEARFALDQVEQNYRRLTGVDAPALLAEEVASATQGPEASHPQLAATQAAARSAQARLNLAQQSRRDAPELALRMVRDRGDFTTPYANALGVKLTLPLSSDARVRQDTSAAQANALQADAELVVAQQRVALDAVRARLALGVVQQQLDIAQERRALTGDTLRLVEKSFALGESDVQTLLRARAAAFEAEAHVHRQRSARAASVSRVNQTLGALP